MAGLVWFAALAKAAHDYWACVVVFIGITILAVLTLTRHAKDHTPIRLPLLIPWLATIAAVWISARHSWDVTSTLWDAWGWTYVGMTFFVAVNGIRSHTQEKLFLRIAACTVFPLVAYALYQQATGAPQGYGLISLGPIHLRFGYWEIHATLINSLVFAGCLAVWFYYWLAERNASVWGWIGLCVTVLGMLLSRSWFIWIALGSGCLVYAKSVLPRPDRKRMIAAGIVGLFVIVVLSFAFKMREIQRHETAPGAYQPAGRVLYWKAALRMVKDNPSTGVGWSGFSSAYPSYKRGHGEGSRFVHSFPLQIPAETGLPGLAAFGFLLIAFLRYRPWTHRLAGSMLLMMGILSLITIFMNFLFCQMLCAVCMALALRKKSSLGWTLTIKPIWACVGIAALVTLSSFWLRLFQAERLYAAGDYQNAIVMNPHHAPSQAALRRIRTN